MDDPQVTESYRTMLGMITGHWTTQIVRTAASLHIAEHLELGPMDSDQISRATGSDPQAIFRLLRACTALGLLTHDNERFSSTGLLRTLLAESPNSLRAFALSQTSPAIWRTLGQVTDAVRLGTSRATDALGTDFFSYLRLHPEEGALFSASMANLSAPVIAEVARGLDTSNAEVAVDIGGAHGTFVLALMERNPELHGIVLDLEHSIAGAEHEAAHRGLTDRFSAVSGDFFQEVPAADIYLLKYILHDWADDECITILRRLREAMRPSARVIVVEMLIDDTDTSDFCALMDIAMLTVATGKERTLAEFDNLLSLAGLQRSRVTAIQPPYSLIEAINPADKTNPPVW